MVLDGKKRKRLSRLYYSLGQLSAFSAIGALIKASGYDRKTVQSFLDEQPVFSLHKQARYHFPRRKIHAPGVGQCFHADLLDLQKLKKFNDSFAWILLAVDVASRKFYAYPLKTKGATDMLEAVVKFLDEVNPTSICTDNGTEWYNSKVSGYFKERMIRHFSTKSELKAVLAERGIRTLKTRMYKFLTYHSTSRWLEALPKFIHNINHTVNRGIGKRPVDVVDSDIPPVPKARKKPKFAVGDCVRLSIARKTFKKGYTQNFTEEQFIVSAVRDDHHPVYYHIKDLNGEPVTGSIYEEELTRSVDEPEGLYKIESIVGKRTYRGVKQVRVKWLGYSETSWVNEDQVVALQND